MKLPHCLFLILALFFSQVQIYPQISQRINNQIKDLKEGEGAWVNLGPSGMPNVAESSNTYGVGQIHRLEFDPGYNGVENQIIYACSSFGGLWRTVNDGETWENVNTDFLPTTSVADVCINPFNSKQLFICSGYADGHLISPISPNWAHVNPINTRGIFRSNDSGKTWENISDGFIEDFSNGGWCRKMCINPLNPNQIFIATTKGIYRTNNAGDKQVKWKRVLKGLEGASDFRGIAFKPDDSNTIYASGTSILRSTDGGETWQSLTGSGFSLDLKNLPDSFQVIRINIAVTPAAPENLYAYLLGTKETPKKTLAGGHIAIFDGTSWKIVESRFSSGFSYFDQTWMAIAVSPVDKGLVCYGNTHVIGSDDVGNKEFKEVSPYCGNGFHADVHELEFQPNVLNPKLFCGNHGGVSVKTFEDMGTGNWEYKNEGLSVVTIWSFDVSEIPDDRAIIGTQDNGTLVYYDTLGYKWHYIKGGDGYSARIDDKNQDVAYYSQGDRSLYRFDFKQFKSFTEVTKLPKDPIDVKYPVITVKTFPLANHPVDGKLWFGFTDLFSLEKEKADFKTPVDEIWWRQSDLYKTEPQSHARQITEIAFSEAFPNTIYIVTAGQQNDPASDWQLESGLFKSNHGGLNNNDMDGQQFVRLNHPGYKVDNDTIAVITGICVHPENPDLVWITFTGINGKYRVWFSENGGKSWSNADPSEVFSSNPVNAIVLQNNERQTIYLGTDYGLYFKDIKSDWQKVENFPSVRITEIKLNEKLMKLYVGTFGRGLWKRNLMK